MPKSIDISGQKFGSLLVVKKRPDRKKWGRSTYECLCDCGATHFAMPDQLKRQAITSCGHCFAHINVGKKFGDLEIIKYTGTKNRLTYVLCKCSCGNIKEIAATFVVRGKVRSCGCARKKVDQNKALAKVGQSHFKLKVWKVIPDDKKFKLLCKCKCGKKIIIDQGDFFYLKSCGCYQKESVPRGEKVWNSKLTNLEAESIRHLWMTNVYSKIKLSEMFNVSIYTIRKVLNNKIYNTSFSKTPAPQSQRNSPLGTQRAK